RNVRWIFSSSSPDVRHYFLISAVNCLRLSFCDYWSNGLAARQRRRCGFFTIFKGNGAAAHRMTDKTTRATAWHEIIRASLKANDVKLIVYVPDRVCRPLSESLHADTYFTTFAATREEEALGILTGAWMGRMRGAALMQTSGFGTIPTA